MSAAQNADRFIRKHLCDSDTLYLSYHMGKRGVRGLLDDYAAYIVANLSLYRATLESGYLDFAKSLCDKVISDFKDETGGFFLYSKEHEELILRPKESYDGAIPSSNSLMAYALVRLSYLDGTERYKSEAECQLDFLSESAKEYPIYHSMFLIALLEHFKGPMKVTIVPDEQTDKRSFVFEFPADALIIFLPAPTKEYPLKNGKTTYYVCKGNSCLPPVNDLNQLNI